MNKIVGINDINRSLLKPGSRCFNCKYISGLKVKDNVVSANVIMCNKLNRQICNNDSYCKYKKENEIQLKIGDLVKTRDELVLYKKYKGISFLEPMKLEQGKIEKIEMLYNKKIYIINGYAYTDEMLEKIEK